MRTLRCVLLAAVILTACSEPPANPSQRPTPAATEPAPTPVSEPTSETPIGVSLYQLVATPERFDGKLVRAIGYVHLDFESNGLYPHEQDYEHAIPRNGIWVELGDCSNRDEHTLSDSYVLLEGRFSSQDQGHLGLWSGALLDVSRCDPWPPRH
jgi:hypothetical protein